MLLLLQSNPEIIEIIEKLFDRLGLDPARLKYVWWAVGALLLLKLLTWLKNLLWEEYIKPLRATPEEKRRLARRRLFATTVAGRIKDINDKEDWSDHHFTELEAEVEAEGERQVFSLIPFITRTRSGLRREKSLSRAIERSRERLIQLEGEPGSGKSVALRFLAGSMAERVMRSGSFSLLIPLYFNLKELNRGGGEAIDRNFIERFVCASLARHNNRDIEAYLEEEFTTGMEEGTWLFLFDSFDEIPEVLSSTEADATIQSYAAAISDFLSGMNRCRGVVASRHFRGPGQSRWPRFRILPLSEERRLRLVRRALLAPAVEREVRAQMEVASPEARNMFSNPMLLGLLCAHMGGGNAFPENTHTVLASYLEHRLKRDGERVRQRYRVSPDEVRAAAEAAAFCMAADTGLGLSPTRAHLKLAMNRQGVGVADNLDSLLDALLFIKLARTEGAGGSEVFTFSHRRFQEYFATCVVLREPGRISASTLLTDARWRETAVVMCQSQPVALLAPLIEEARRVVGRITDALRPHYGEVKGAAARAAARETQVGLGEEEKKASARWPPERFLWPHGAIHFLGLMQEGFRRRPADLPADFRDDVGDAVYVVEATAGLYDRMCGLEVAGAAPERVLLTLLRTAFASDSQLLKDIAYRQAAGLVQVPDDVAASILRAVHALAISGRLHRERFATRAHLTRLEKSERFTLALNLLLSIRTVDLLLNVAFVAFLVLSGWQGGVLTQSWWFAPAVVLTPLLSHACLRLIFVARTTVNREALASLVFVLRAGLLASIAFAAHLQPVPGERFFYLTLGVYVSAWAPVALFAARMGLCTKWVWWPVIPLSPMLIPVGGTVTGLKKSRPAKLLLYALLAIVLTVPVAFLMLLFFSLVSLAFFVYLAVIAPPLLLLLIPTGLISYQDWRRWQKRRAVYALGQMSGIEFANELVRYNTTDFLLRFVKATRTQGWLSANRESDEVLGKLSLIVERMKLSGQPSSSEVPLWDEIKGGLYDLRLLKRRQSPPVLQDLDGFDEWHAQTLGQRPSGYAMVSAEILDELILLLAQVRATRRDWPAAVPGPDAGRA